MTDETKQVLEVVKEMFEALNAKIDGLGTEMKTRMAKIETTLRRRTPYSRQQTDTSATEPRKQLPTPATVTSTNTATTLQNPTRQ